MSKDIRSFFKVLSTNKSPQSKAVTPSNSNKKKRPVIVDSSDEDVVPETPTSLKTGKHAKKRKLATVSSDTDDEKKVVQPKKNGFQLKNTNVNLKPIDVSSTFTNTPIKQAALPEKPLKPNKTPEKDKNVMIKKKGKTKLNINTEIGIHNDKNFEKALLDLDDDFLLANVDQLDKSINDALKANDVKNKSNSEISTKLEKTLKQDVKESRTTDTPKKKKPAVEHYDGDPDQERYEKKRQSIALYQKYLNRSGPAHHGSKEYPKGTPDCLKNICFLRTGVLDSLDTDEFETIIKEHGGRVVQSVSKKVNYVVVGEDPGPAKLEKAKNYGIKLLSEDELLDLIRVKSGIQPRKKEIVELDNEVIEDHEKTKHSQKASDKKLLKVDNNKTFAVNKRLNGTPIENAQSKAKENAATTSEIKTNTITNSINKQPDGKIVDNSLPWTEKYKPKTIKSIIGQQTDKSIVKRLMKWLENWYKNHGCKNKPKLIKPSPWAKDDSGSFFKAALLSGPPGIGKTTTATLVAKELGFDIVEFNASDTRSKKLLHEEVSQLLSTTSLTGYFTSGSAPTKKHVLLMDEVDGMAGNEDRGGVQELISLIKNSNVPIICMCNDRNHQKIRSLSNYCFDLRFSRPRLEQIKGAMMSVCFKEGVKINSETLSEIITSSGMDIRQVLTHLSLWTAEKKENTTQDIKAPKKDTPLGQWEVCRKVFSAEDQKSTNIAEREKLFYYDYSLAPLFVHENYLKVQPHAPKNEHLKLFSAAASSISMGDIVDTKIRRTNNWSLLNVEAMCLSVLPGAYVSGHVNGQIDFPSWLGKNSKRTKFVRLLGELQAHMRTSISGNRSEVNLDYISPLRMNIVNPLMKHGVDGVHDALNVMHSYNLLREDLDSIVELAQWPKQKDPMNMVDSKVKAAFTRSYNKVNAKLPYAVQGGVSKKRGAASNEEEYALVDGEEDSDSNEDDKDITKDAMIKAKKPSTKVSKKDEPSTSNKRGTKGGTGRSTKKVKK